RPATRKQSAGEKSPAAPRGGPPSDRAGRRPPPAAAPVHEQDRRRRVGRVPWGRDGKHAGRASRARAPLRRDSFLSPRVPSSRGRTPPTALSRESTRRAQAE